MGDHKKQDFWPKINIPKGNHCILRIRREPVRQKLGLILENKVVQKLKLEKSVFFKILSPKLIILNVVGPKKQDFWPKINIRKGNNCILRIQGAPVHQKLGMILENKVVQKLELEKMFVFFKNWSPKMILLNDFF